MNKTIVTGNLGRDAEIKTTKGGKDFIAFSVANTEKRAGEDVTTWFGCSIFNEKMVAGTIIKYLTKGKKVLIEGSYSPSTWAREDGTVEISHNFLVYNIELFGGNDQDAPAAQTATAKLEKATAAAPTEEASEDDDLPF